MGFSAVSPCYEENCYSPSPKLSNFHSQYTLFESVVKRTLLYGGAVWALRYRSELEPVQNNYFRTLLGMHPWTKTAVVRRETASSHLEASLWEQILMFLYKIKRMEPERYAATIFKRLSQLDRDGSSCELNWVSQVRIGLLPFGLDSLLTASPEEIAEYYKTSMEIIRTHFRNQDDYDLDRLENFPQYRQEFLYGEEQHLQGQPGAQVTEKVDRRWKQLPWHLKSKLDLQTKRLITQLRQNQVYMRFRDTVVSVPHPKVAMTCKMCWNQVIDSPQHAIMECPVTAVTAKTLKEHGWTQENFVKFLDSPWEDVTLVSKLIMQPIRMRLFVSTEITEMSRRC